MTLLTVPPLFAGVIALAAAVALGLASPRLALDRPWVAIAAGVLVWPLFFSLRSHVLNTDGNLMTPKFERDVPLLGAHLTHDEVLELFIHSRVWHYTHRWWNWSVVFSYQVVSCIAGSVFICLLIRLARRLASASAWLFLAGSLSGAYMQLFFGDTENYTMTAVIVVGYLMAGHRFLAGESSLRLPAAVLAVACCFHLEAAWLAPSIAYLAWVSRAREGNLREATRAAALGAAIVAATFVFFHFNGLPLRRFFSSHAGRALRLRDVFALGMPFAYFAEQGQLVLRLCPAFLMIVPLALWRRFGADEVTIFLGLASASMLSMHVIWKAQLGVAEDWNLYAIGGLVTTVFLWRTIAMSATTVPLRVAAAALAATGWLRTYAWIVANHRAGG